MRSLDVEHRDAQIAVVRERLRDDRLQVRVGEELAPADIDRALGAAERSGIGEPRAPVHRVPPPACRAALPPAWWSAGSATPSASAVPGW